MTWNCCDIIEDDLLSASFALVQSGLSLALTRPHYFGKATPSPKLCLTPQVVGGLSTPAGVSGTPPHVSASIIYAAFLFSVWPSNSSCWASLNSRFFLTSCDLRASRGFLSPSLCPGLVPLPGWWAGAIRELTSFVFFPLGNHCPVLPVTQCL